MFSRPSSELQQKSNCMFACVYEYVCMQVCVCMYVCMYVNECVCSMFIRLFVWRGVFFYTRVKKHTSEFRFLARICVCVYIYIYICLLFGWNMCTNVWYVCEYVGLEPGGIFIHTNQFHVHTHERVPRSYSRTSSTVHTHERVPRSYSRTSSIVHTHEPVPRSYSRTSSTFILSNQFHVHTHEPC